MVAPMLANRRAWEKIPEDVRTIVAKNINAAAIKEREDTAKLNANLRGELESKLRLVMTNENSGLAM